MEIKLLTVGEELLIISALKFPLSDDCGRVEAQDRDLN